LFLQHLLLRIINDASHINNTAIDIKDHLS